MRKPWSIRARLIFLIMTMSLMGLAAFAVISQLRLNAAMQDSVDGRVEGGLKRSDLSMTLVLEKYHTLLYDLCMDEELTELVEAYNAVSHVGDQTGERSREQLWDEISRKLEYVCDRNEGVMGLTVFAENGDCIYYDGLSSPSRESVWLLQSVDPVMSGLERYQPVRYATTVDGEDKYIFSIQRKLLDDRDSQKETGSVAICVEESVIRDCMETVEGEFFCVVQNRVIISAPDRALIGKSVDRLIEEKNGEGIRDLYQVASIRNGISGWDIVEFFPLDRFYATMEGQARLFVLMLVVTGMILIFAVIYAIRPVIQSVEAVLDGMQRVEKGDFSARVEKRKDMPVEVVKITNGFNEMVERTNQLLVRSRQAAVEQKNAEISALEAQIDPHFLYNTLDTINWKAISRNEYEISEMVGDLADILRYAIKNAGGVSTLGQEVAWLKKYVRLQQEKLGKKIQVFCCIPPETAGCAMHKLLLQPFVENSIAHGLPGIEREPILIITGSVQDGVLYVKIRDNGKGVSGERLELLNREDYHRENHFGVENVRKRLRLYYGGAAGVSFDAKEGEYMEVTLRLPAQEAVKHTGNTSEGVIK